MAKRPLRDLTTAQQLARGPVDLPFFMLTMILLGVGLVMMFSASYATAYYDARFSADFYISNQFKYALLGVFCMYWISKFDYQYYRVLAIPGIVGSVILLALVFSPLGWGKAETGAQRWIALGSITLQPSEFAKVAVIIFFSARLAKRGTEPPRLYTKRTVLGRALNRLEKIGFLELVPYGLVLLSVLIPMLMQPHMSGSILVLVGAASVLFASGVHLGWFVGSGGLIGAALWFIINKTPYMSARINIWKNPWLDPTGDGFQIIQSIYAIGSGGLLGLGLGQSRQKYLYVPEPENDFVFPIVVEELGFIGASLIIVLFMLLILRGYWIALHSRDRFGALLAVGIITLLAVQVFLNISVVTNFTPTTGISLPFFSYGGTALLIQLGQMGIILSVSRQMQVKPKE